MRRDRRHAVGKRRLAGMRHFHQRPSPLPQLSHLGSTRAMENIYIYISNIEIAVRRLTRERETERERKEGDTRAAPRTLRALAATARFFIAARSLTARSWFACASPRSPSLRARCSSCICAACSKLLRRSSSARLSTSTFGSFGLSRTALSGGTSADASRGAAGD